MSPELSPVPPEFTKVPRARTHDQRVGDFVKPCFWDQGRGSCASSIEAELLLTYAKVTGPGAPFWWCR